MLAEVEKLLRVQHHDQKIKALEKELAGIPLEEEDIKQRLEENAKAVEEAKSTFQHTEVAIKNLELDVETRRDSIAKLKVQQFETRKNEEFRRMGSEIERYEKEISELEDREMELMETAEEQKKVLNEARRKVTEDEESVAEELEDLASLKANLEAEREAEIAERGKHEADVEETLLDTYRRLFKAKHGLAVVGLVDEICQGCHMKVVKSTVVKVKGDKRVATCENCGRILYWWTDDSVGKNKGEY
ncbi:MAG: C4-type zinc ribbon domain-containing protein [Verrucomicrobiales bacterium]